MHERMSDWKALLQQGLDDDAWQWDWTAIGTLGSKKANKIVRAEVVAKGEGIWAADPLVAAINQFAREVGSTLAVKSRVEDGDRLKKGQVVCEWRGPARLLLALERPFLNIASYAGGIALRTRGFVDAAGKACPKGTPRVTSTRKILPHYRDVAIHGVLCGGGFSHRVNLAGGVLIKENHITAAGGIRLAIEGARAVAPHGLKIEVEVRDERELKQAIDAGAEIVLLDNFTPGEVRAALKIVDRAKARPLVEVSGGVDESTIGSYAMPGVDLISVGGLTHSVRAIDLSLLVRG